jgi:hypothetical protein
LSNWTVWQRDPDKLGKDAARVWLDIYDDVNEQLNRCGVFEMTCGCDDASRIYRIGSDGIYEYSDDGGETWTDAPELDPRNTTTQAPPLTPDGDVSKCAGAENVVAAMQNQVAEYIDGLGLSSSIAAIGAVIVGFAAVFVSGGTLAPVVAALAVALITAGVSAVTAAFTSDVWSDFKCAVFCNIADDGTITPAAFEQIKADMAGDIVGVAYDILSKNMDVFGAGGMTNQARTGSGSGASCGDCECEPCDPDFEFTRLTWSFLGCTTGTPDVVGTRCNDGGHNRWALDDTGTSYIQIDMGDRHGTEITEYLIQGPVTGSGNMIINMWVSDLDEVIGSGTMIGTYDTATELNDWHAASVLASGRYLRLEYGSGASLLVIGGGGASAACP